MTVRPSASTIALAQRAKREVEALAALAQLLDARARAPPRPRPRARSRRRAPGGRWRLRRRRSGRPRRPARRRGRSSSRRAAARSRSASRRGRAAPRRLAISPLRARSRRLQRVRSRRCRIAVVVAKMVSPRRSESPMALCGSSRSELGGVLQDGGLGRSGAERRRQRPKERRERAAREPATHPPLPQRAVRHRLVAPLRVCSRPQVLARGTAIDSDTREPPARRSGAART